MNSQYLNEDEIFESAAAGAGLQQYEEGGVRKRFSQVIEALNNYGTIAEAQRPAAIAELASHVERRLSLSRDWSIYKEIEDEKIEKPFFVLGKGRTGTTAMQNLLALEEGSRAPLAWECGQPSPPPGMDIKSDKERIAKENAYMNELVNICPGMLLAHPYVDAGAYMETEDEEFFSIDFHTIHPMHYIHVPVIPYLFNNKVSGADEAFKFHKKILKHLQWKKSTNRWVCKGTLHHYQAPVLWETYPDALCIWMHRDPAIFIASTLRIIEYIYGGITGLKVQGQMVENMVDGIAAGFESVMDSDWLNDKRLIHIRFNDMVRDPIGSIRNIYDYAGLEVSSEYEKRMTVYLADPANKSDRHGKYLYSLEKYGLNAEDTRRRFARYYDRFVIEL